MLDDTNENYAAKLSMEYNQHLNKFHPMCHFFPRKQSRLKTIKNKLERLDKLTFKPSWAALIAATYPPGPEPITVKSYSSVEDE